jgi:hypothetical protein
MPARINKSIFKGVGAPEMLRQHRVVFCVPFVAGNALPDTAAHVPG